MTPSEFYSTQISAADLCSKELDIFRRMRREEGALYDLCFVIHVRLYGHLCGTSSYNGKALEIASRMAAWQRTERVSFISVSFDGRSREFFAQEGVVVTRTAQRCFLPEYMVQDFSVSGGGIFDKSFITLWDRCYCSSILLFSPLLSSPDMHENPCFWPQLYKRTESCCTIFATSQDDFLYVVVCRCH